MDYVPKKRNLRYLWYKNLHDKIETEAPKFGLTAGEATATKTLVAGVLAKMDATDAAETAAAGARSVEKNAEGPALGQLRGKIRNWKTLTAFPTAGSEAVLKLRGAEIEFDHATYQPVLKVSIEAGRIKIEFEKKGVDGVAVYCRLRGTAAWRRIGTDTDSPYFDTAPLAVAGVPEVREYMARGMIDDDEIGLDSDIVSIAFAG